MVARRVLLLALAALCASLPVRASADPPMEPLRFLADRAGILIGAASAYPHLVNKSDSNYPLVLSKQYSVTTEMHNCRWNVVHPQISKFDFAKCDFVVNYARQFNMSFRYTTLVAGDNNPSWLNGLSAAQLRSTLTQHVTVVASRYRRQIPFFNVVSNAMAEDGSGLKNVVPWYPQIPDYVSLAFKTAAAANPFAKLFYNDYGGEGLSAKSNGIYQMLQGLIQNGVPVHGVGLQMHVSVSNPPDPRELHHNIDRLNHLGLEVHITEMDVTCDPCGLDAREVQARIYRDVLHVCLMSQKCRCVETWGFTDRYPPTYTTSPAVDALPWDSDYQPKPAVFEMERVLRHDWDGPDDGPEGGI